MATPKAIADFLTQRKHNEDRIRRANAWLTRSSQPGTENLERFIFLWISFNAAYGDEKSLMKFSETRSTKSRPEKASFLGFLDKVIRHDSGSLNEIFDKDLRESIRTFLENPCISEQFWKFVRGKAKKSGNWKDWHEEENEKVINAWTTKNLRDLLPLIFSRLYILRNQVIHGGATYPRGIGVRQIQHGTAIMGFLVPRILKIMETNIEKYPDSGIWGQVAYPSIDPGLLTSMGITGHEMPLHPLENPIR